MNETPIEMLGTKDSARLAQELGLAPQLAKLNIFRLLLRRPRAAKLTADLLLELLSGNALDHRLRELVIMRIGWRTNCDYEWTQHWAIAQHVFGIDPEELVAVRNPESHERLGESACAALAATDEILATGTLSSAARERCREAFGDDAVVELALVVGLWHAVSEVVRSLEVPLEEGIASWPPDGRGPA